MSKPEGPAVQEAYCQGFRDALETAAKLVKAAADKYQTPLPHAPHFPAWAANVALEKLYTAILAAKETP